MKYLDNLRCNMIDFGQRIVYDARMQLYREHLAAANVPATLGDA